MFILVADIQVHLLRLVEVGSFQVWSRKAFSCTA